MTMCSIKSEKNSKNEARTWYFDLKARPLSSVSIESNFENDDVSEVVTVSNLLLTSVLEESFIWRSMSPRWAIFLISVLPTLGRKIENFQFCTKLVELETLHQMFACTC